MQERCPPNGEFGLVPSPGDATSSAPPGLTAGRLVSVCTQKFRRSHWGISDLLHARRPQLRGPQEDGGDRGKALTSPRLGGRLESACTQIVRAISGLPAVFRAGWAHSCRDTGLKSAGYLHPSPCRHNVRNSPSVPFETAATTL
jgi:hypothetical protein